MTEQSTPTPTERGHYVRANMPWGDTINLDVDGNWWRLGLEPLTLDEVAMYGPLLRLSCPAEVADMVRAGAEEAWKQGALWSAVEVGAIRSIHDAWLVPDDNPHSKPNTDTTEPFTPKTVLTPQILTPPTRPFTRAGWQTASVYLEVIPEGGKPSPTK